MIAFQISEMASEFKIRHSVQYIILALFRHCFYSFNGNPRSLHTFGYAGYLNRAAHKTFLKSTPAPFDSCLDQRLRNNSPTYLALLEAIQKKFGLLPPSGFLSGVYARTDQQRWV